MSVSERGVFELATSLIRQAGMESGPCTIFKQLARNIFEIRLLLDLQNTVQVTQSLFFFLPVKRHILVLLH